MKAVEHLYTYLSREIPQSTARLVFPITSLVSLSVLSLILTYRYFRRRQRQEHLMDANIRQDQNAWIHSALEKGDPSFQSSFPASACDILRPLSQTSSCPTSGALAAMALGHQNEHLRQSSGPIMSSNPALETGQSVSKSDKLVQQMSDEDSEGMRTWKRVVVQYK